MLHYQKIIFFLLGLFISFNSYAGGDEQEEKRWIYQSILGERVVYRESNGSVSKTSYDVTSSKMECFDERFVLCLQSSAVDIVVPHTITDMWESDWSKYRLLKDKLTINLLDTEIENYIVFQSVKKHVSCKIKNDCGTIILYSYENGLIGFGLRRDDKWAVLYLSDQECNLGGTCLAKW